MHVLIVGAGSIGQLYGYFIQRGGASVDVYVKPHYVEDAERGYRLYERRKGLQSPDVFSPDGICTSPDEVATQTYDTVILCISSAGLRGSWFEDFADAIGDTPLVSLIPGIDNRDYFLKYVDEAQLAQGLITAVSYPAPLPGEEASEPGTAYWLPPLTPAFFQGPKDLLQPLLQALNGGGMRARMMRKLAERSAMGTAVLIPAVAVLETVDWSLAELRRSREHRKLVDEAADEALSVVENHFNTRRPFPLRMLGPISWRGIFTAAPVPPPFDLETYLQVHFTKTGDQTRMYIDECIERRQHLDAPSPVLQRLREELGDTPEYPS